MTAELKNTSLLLILLSNTISKTMLWQSAIVSIARTLNFVNTLLCIYMSFVLTVLLCMLMLFGLLTASLK